MVYTPLTCFAMGIAYNAHHMQADKGGWPYIHHPMHVAEQMDDEDSTIVALLHDVVEDSDITIEELEAEGFRPHVIEAIDLLSRKKGQSYNDYIWKIKPNSLARKVKIADLEHNLDLTRLACPSKEFLDHMKMYKKSLTYLQDITKI
jgi:(p)ppGpp synthase/HD superfamily hydrolase